jgi:leucine dehydrogenase
VMHGLKAVLEARLDRDDLHGVHVALQGLGNVGWKLAELLHAAGARLTVADIRPERVARAREAFGATGAAVDAIHAVAADIFAPCALGGVIDRTTVDELRVKAVAGAANNPLVASELDDALGRRGILFAPDFVLNAGGILGAVEEIARVPGRSLAALPPLDARLARIGDRLREVFARARADQESPTTTATRMARELIAAAPHPR